MVSMKNTKRPFINVGSHLSIELINTQFICHGEMVDLLTELDDVVRWSKAMEIELTPSLSEQSLNKQSLNEQPLDKQGKPIDIDEIRRFRSALKALFTAYSDGDVFEEEDLALLNQHLLAAPLQQQLTCEDSIALQPVFKQLTIRQLLGKVAQEAAMLLSSPQGENIKTCSNPKCILMFVDVSRAKKRRWCSMERCGNRAKASTFYHSHKQA